MAFIPLAAAGIGAIGSIAGGLLASKGSNKKESKIQTRQRRLVDELMNSLYGKGEFSDLFDPSDEKFQKSFVEPAKQRFNNQIAPQIQQQYISSGQQKSSGMDDQLLRAGVDLNSMLDQYAYQNQQDAMNRKQGAMNSILGSGPGQAPNPSTGQNLSSAIGGYLASNSFKEGMTGLLNSYSSPSSAPTSSYAAPPRKGFEPDYNTYKDWKLGDSRWGQ